MAGILTKGVELQVYGTSSYNAIAGLQEFPGLGGTKDKVDVTTLADNNYQYIPGIEDYGDMRFKFLYTKEVYDQLTGYENNVKQFCVAFPGANEVKFYFSGIVDVTIDGAGVNNAITMTVNIFLQSDVTNTEPTH